MQLSTSQCSLSSSRCALLYAHALTHSRSMCASVCVSPPHTGTTLTNTRSGHRTIRSYVSSITGMQQQCVLGVCLCPPQLAKLNTDASVWRVDRRCVSVMSPPLRPHPHTDAHTLTQTHRQTDRRTDALSRSKPTYHSRVRYTGMTPSIQHTIHV
uniref:Uncharacterized protein n=1 Tax=Vitrella brassicaformis TaxID=1169539 RepID=A0A7S1KHS5_9ALVE|mmetsp:Transcript_5790/g.13867  ORF Transcript_5790/g.13867 Transcript_5790/m.13867 type:complete len:155 (+) Transcript_5790:556-1020(+)